MPNLPVRLLMMAAVLAGSMAVPASSQRNGLAMLDGLEHGRWDVRLRDASQSRYPICMATGRELIQLRHEALSCDRLIVSDTPDQVTVQYTCRGRGYGRTTIRRETGRLVQIQSQGIADGLPFDFQAEARRTGSCAG